MARLLQIAASTLLSGGILGGSNWMGYISNATRQAIGMGLAELSEGQVHYFSKHHDLLKRAAIQIVSQTAYGLLRSYPRYLQYWEQRVRDKYLETQSQSSLANKTGQYTVSHKEKRLVEEASVHNAREFEKVGDHGVNTVFLHKKTEFFGGCGGISVAEVVVSAENISVFCEENTHFLIASDMLAHTVGKLNDATDRKSVRGEIDARVDRVRAVR